MLFIQIFEQNTGQRSLFTNNQWERVEHRRSYTPTANVTKYFISFRNVSAERQTNIVNIYSPLGTR